MYIVFYFFIIFVIRKVTVHKPRVNKDHYNK